MKDRETEQKKKGFEAPGSLVLAFLLLVVLIVLYFANWALLAQAWPVR